MRSNSRRGCPHVPGDPVSTGPGGPWPADLPGAAPPDRVNHLYVCQGLSTCRIATIVGISRQRGGRLLRRAGLRSSLAVPDDDALPAGKGCQVQTPKIQRI